MSQASDRPRDRQALVTGASNGIGRAVVRRLTAAGWQCITLDVEAPRTFDVEERFFAVDLSDREALAELLVGISRDHQITGLVNNVGASLTTPVQDVTHGDFERLSQINLWCPVQCLQAVLPNMRKARQGRVVNVSSRAALGKAGRTIYSATKAGVHGLTRTWALELAREGITVNTVSPGPIATDMFYRLNPADSASTAEIVGLVPVQRMGAADEVAHAITYFMDEGAAFTTGQVLHVCGGLTVGVG